MKNFFSTCRKRSDSPMIGGSIVAINEEHVKMRVGPITNLVIENETTDEKLDFTGYTLASGQTMTIDLRYGYKTVEREDGSSLIDKLTTDSDLGTWHIAAHPEATDGYNTIAVQGSNADLNTQISFQFYTQYAGI